MGRPWVDLYMFSFATQCERDSLGGCGRRRLGLPGCLVSSGDMRFENVPDAVRGGMAKTGYEENSAPEMLVRRTAHQLGTDFGSIDRTYRVRRTWCFLIAGR